MLKKSASPQQFTGIFIHLLEGKVIAFLPLK